MSKILNFIVSINNDYKHFFTIIAVTSGFIFNYYRTDQVNKIFQKEKVSLESRLLDCENKRHQFDLTEKRLKRIELELNAWQLSAMMYSKRHPDDSFHLAVIEALMYPVFDSDTLFTDVKTDKK